MQGSNDTGVSQSLKIGGHSLINRYKKTPTRLVGVRKGILIIKGECWKRPGDPLGIKVCSKSSGRLKLDVD
jgi:hypothetical protein